MGGNPDTKPHFTAFTSGADAEPAPPTPPPSTRGTGDGATCPHEPTATNLDCVQSEGGQQQCTRTHSTHPSQRVSTIPSGLCVSNPNGIHVRYSLWRHVQPLQRYQATGTQLKAGASPRSSSPPPPPCSPLPTPHKPLRTPPSCPGICPRGGAISACPGCQTACPRCPRYRGGAACSTHAGAPCAGSRWSQVLGRALGPAHPAGTVPLELTHWQSRHQSSTARGEHQTTGRLLQPNTARRMIHTSKQTRDCIRFHQIIVYNPRTRHRSTGAQRPCLPHLGCQERAHAGMQGRQVGSLLGVQGEAGHH
jgi:hypothetical protein